ncbi:conserved archaeal protein [Hyperthermus butylicus DSM 5456]|uniref:Ribonuclease VapC n=1 Tax=Hyperthermus butylicus (strain DSM 5456 / JCM 9403 / PLM1-5) TaxID=415426 RepID=A2BMH5_HYPBU|nr:conserved archaeal protein [Hyperthermus butylicus DSM 5456]
MTKPLLPDTNVLVYETVEDSPHHEEAANIIDAAAKIILPSIVVHEYIWVMVKKLGVPPGFVTRKLQEYLEDPRTRYLAEPPTALYQALRLLEEHSASPREVNDYIILATAMYHGTVLATFDEKLRKLAQKLGVETTP